MNQGAVNRICKCNLSPSCCHYLTCNYIVLANCLNWFFKEADSLGPSLLQSVVSAVSVCVALLMFC